VVLDTGAHGPSVAHTQRGGDGRALALTISDLGQDFIQDGGDNAAVNDARERLVVVAEPHPGEQTTWPVLEKQP
jgi:hypothetical protein